MRKFLTAMALCLVGSGLWSIFRHDEDEEPTPQIQHSSSADDMWSEKYLCWHCHEFGHVPPEFDRNAEWTMTCDYCNMDNRLYLGPIDSGEVYLGHMVVINRVAQYF